jgi:hypothetical protein
MNSTLSRIVLALVVTLFSFALLGCPWADLADTLHAITITATGQMESELIYASACVAEEGSEVRLVVVLGTGRQVELSAPGVTLTPSLIATTGVTSSFTMPASDVEVTAAFDDTVQPGDTGPAGGIVFYDDAVGFDFDGLNGIESIERDLLDGTNDGVVSGDRFLEAAPAYWYSSGAPDPNALWGLAGVNTSVPDGPPYPPPLTEVIETVGDGESNTALLVADLAGETGYAAQICDDYWLGTRNDWFLPSVGELAILFGRKDLVGEFAEAIYWSSSEVDDQTAHQVDFQGGAGTYTHYFKNAPYLLRPIRAF